MYKMLVFGLALLTTLGSATLHARSYEEVLKEPDCVKIRNGFHDEYQSMADNILYNAPFGKTPNYWANNLEKLKVDFDPLVNVNRKRIAPVVNKAISYDFRIFSRDFDALGRYSRPDDSTFGFSLLKICTRVLDLRDENQ